jgi:signal transduction histidine kinase
MAQFDAATVRLRREPQDIRELIDTTVEEMRALLRDRIVEVQVESGITSIPMDREFIRRALRHLIENAVRYSRPDSTISISATRDGYRLLLEVADQGSGVDPGDQPFVFDKFYRGRQHQASSQGTGMGLAIVKAIMEAHGGGVALSSAPESGSRFTLWLPLQ